MAELQDAYGHILDELKMGLLEGAPSNASDFITWVAVSRFAVTLLTAPQLFWRMVSDLGTLQTVTMFFSTARDTLKEHGLTDGLEWLSDRHDYKYRLFEAFLTVFAEMMQEHKAGTYGRTETMEDALQTIRAILGTGEEA